MTQGVAWSTLNGANDDERLLDYDKQRKLNPAVHGWPALLDQPRVYTFTRPFALSDGFSMVGSIRPQDQPRGSKPLSTQVNLRLTAAGGWLTLPNGPTFGTSLVGLSFDANSNSRVFHPNASGVLWTSQLRDISYQNGPGIMGFPGQMQPNDCLTVEGWCNWNNIREVAINWGGSDSAICPTKLLIDSPPAFLGPQNYLVKFSSMSKTDVSGFYMTCDQHSGILLANSNNMLTFTRMFIEGRNANTPCFGALVRASCSYSQWSNSWFAYGMTNPAAGPAPNDSGLFHATSGTHELIDCHTKRANGVPETSPFAFGTGAGTKLIVRNIVGEGYTGKPVVRVVNGAKADTDTSVQVIYI